MNGERTDRVNRALLTLIGVLLLAVGTAALLHSTGALGRARRESPVLASPTVSWYAAHGSWFWPTLAGVAALVLILAVWWASAQIRLNGAGLIALDRHPGGAVTVTGGHLAECIERDAAAQPEIERARVHLTRSESTLHVWLTVWVGPPYDVGRAVARITKNVLPNVRSTLDGAAPIPLSTHVTVETAETTISRLA